MYHVIDVINYYVFLGVEFDQQCSTTQPEDVLQIYIRNRVASKSSLNTGKLSGFTSEIFHNCHTTFILFFQLQHQQQL